MENPDGNNEEKELIEKLLKSYDNVQYEQINIEDDSTYMDDMTLYELKINEQGSFDTKWRHGFFTEKLDLM